MAMSRNLYIELLLIKKGVSSGYQEYVFNLLNYFYNHREEIRYDNIIIWCKDSEKEAFDSFRDCFEVRGFSFSSFYKRLYLQTILPIKEKVGGNDLVFYPGNTSGLLKRGKELLTVHDLLFKRKNWLPKRLMRIHREIFIPRSLRKADAVVAISNFTKDDIEKYYPFAKGKIHVVYNSMNFRKFGQQIKSQNCVGYFLAICSNAFHKNLSTILKGFECYCKKGGDKNLVFVGKIKNSGPAFDIYNSFPSEIRERIKTVVNIPNEELGQLYINASAYVSASLFEGLGMPVVEAMSFNLPVILSDIPPHREVSMNRGVYFNATDYEELSEKMIKLATVGCNCADKIKTVFSEENTSARYVELINRMNAESQLGGGKFRLESRVDSLELARSYSLAERRVAA